MQRADCVHFSGPFYIRDLNIRRFWYVRGMGESFLELMPHRS